MSLTLVSDRPSAPQLRLSAHIYVLSSLSDSCFSRINLLVIISAWSALHDLDKKWVWGGEKKLLDHWPHIFSDSLIMCMIILHSLILTIIKLSSQLFYFLPFLTQQASVLRGFWEICLIWLRWERVPLLKPLQERGQNWSFTRWSENENFTEESSESLYKIYI